MKKLLEKDKKTRKKIQNFEKKKLVLKILLNNLNLTNLIRFNALTSLNKTDKKTSKVFISNRCINTINKRKFNKFTKFSRMVFLKLARSKKINGLIKASW
jgi:ribosomal protein S14